MKIRIKAIDTLFFRNGRPFNKGEESWAEGIFPPAPSVIYGALRTDYLNQVPEIIPDSESDPTKDIRINGIYFEYENTLYHAAPKDFLKLKDVEEDENQVKLVPLRLQESNSIASSTQTKYIPYSDDDIEDFQDGIIMAGEYDSYLNEYVDCFNAKSLGKLVKDEPKVGIAIDNTTKTAKEGKLYRVGMKRLYDLNLIIDFDPPQIQKPGDIYCIRFGGENRIAQIELLPDDKYNEDIQYQWENKQGNYFKLHLLTPAVFENGWYPDLKLMELNYEIIPIAAFVGKHLNIGGFDIRQNAPKTMYRMVPAGSVYYYEIPEGKSEALINSIEKLRTLNDIRNEEERTRKSKEGFGLFKIAFLPFENLVK